MTAGSTAPVFAFGSTMELNDMIHARQHRMEMLLLAAQLPHLFSLSLLDEERYMPLHPVPIVIEAYQLDQHDFAQQVIETVDAESKETALFLLPLQQPEQSWYIPRSLPLRTRTRTIQFNRSRYARSRL
jgi:hypothetical protein